jgi:hypothetical protein
VLIVAVASSMSDRPVPRPIESGAGTGEPGADEPDAAIRWILLAQRDENGNIAPDALMRARRQLDAMRAREAELRRLNPGAPQEIAGVSPGAWAWVGPGNVGGRTRALAIHPTTTSTIFAGGVSGGIWKTTNNGGVWAVVADFMANLAVTSIVYRPGDPSTMFASTGEGFFNFDAIQGAGIFKSIDGGTTWPQLPSTANSNFFWVNRIAFSADGNTLLAATRSGLYRSTDLGASWSLRLTAGNGLLDVEFLPGSNTHAVAGGTARNAYFSIDGGLTWNPSAGFCCGSTFQRVELGAAPSSPLTVYASVAEGGTSSSPPAQVWKSLDGGATYALASIPGHLGAQGWYDNVVWVDPTNADHVISGGVSLSRSVSGGASFASLGGSIHADHHAIVADPGFNGTTNRRVYFGNDGGIYRLDDANTNVFTRLNNNYGVTQFYGGAGIVTNGKILGGTQDNGTLVYTPASGPQAWTTMFGGDGGFSAADNSDPSYMYGELQWLGVHRSTNGGSSSSLITGCSKSPPYRLDDSCNQTTNFISPILLDPNQPNRLLAGGQSLWRTDDARTPNTASTGPSWAVIKPPTSPVSYLTAITVALGNSDVIWVGHGNGDVYMTLNGTAPAPIWTRRDNTSPALPNRAVTSIAVDPADPNTAYVAFGGYVAGNLWKTVNGGTTWTDATGSLPDRLPFAPVRSVVVHPSESNWLYVGTEVGVFASDTAGATWRLPHEGPSNVAVFQLFFMGMTLVAVTHGRGMSTADTTPVITPPSILAHPQNAFVAAGQTATLSVAATGSAPFSYQWYRGLSPNTAIPIGGATGPSYTTPSLAATTSYWVRISNAAGGVNSNTATVQVGVTRTFFSDNLESGGAAWVPGAPWALTTESAHGGTYAWSDSPGGPYGANTNASLVSGPINLSSATAPRLTFWHRRDFAADGADAGRVWITTNGGGSYTLLQTYVGTNLTWTEATLDLTPFAGAAALQIVFQVNTNATQSGDGWYVDDIAVSENTRRVSADFDFDGRTDRTVFRPDDGGWYSLRSTGAMTSVLFGAAGDIDVPGDFDGDGKTDLAVFRPSDGVWYILQSQTGTLRAVQFGASGDVPLAADVDADGKRDLIVFRPSAGTWYALLSSGGMTGIAFGAPGDVPLVGDWDGDGRADFTVWRPSDGYWYVAFAAGGYTAFPFGSGALGDVPVAGDWNGDGRTDYAVWRSGTGIWYIFDSAGAFSWTSWGSASLNDVPLAGDWDGDGKTDIAIWRPGTGVWHVVLSSGGYSATPWGAASDRPVSRRPGG